jgi:co-chaperonin GroES (HSP10)
VKDDLPLDDLQARAEQAGLALVSFEHSIPKPTTGVVVAVGSDPEVQRLIHVGDRVFFGMNCGLNTTVEGETFRSLEFHELTSVIPKEEEKNNEKDSSI